jgi:hypothetical protein
VPVVPLTLPLKLGDKIMTLPVVPVNLRVEQSSTPESSEVNVVPVLTLESEASGVSASVRAPDGTSVILITPLAGSWKSEPGVGAQEYVPE